MFVYLLMTKNTTYVGATVDVNRRLRQHNREITGGAKATKRMVDKGHKWTRVCYVSGFPTWQAALQFEWKWKYIARKLPKYPKLSSLQKKLEALNILLASDKSTSTSIPFEQWPSPPVVHEE
jgi:structure-specific endonuclease subunit SLX1